MANWTEQIDALPEAQAKALLTQLLRGYLEPAFGALPKREIDLLFFRALTDAGLIARDAPVYQLMTDLRITRTKARNLLFDQEIRSPQMGGLSLDEQVRKVILTDSYFKDGNHFVLEIESPVLQAHLREICRRAKVVTDASFNPSLVRMPVSGLAAVLDQLLTDAEKAAVKKGLIRAGKIDDKSFAGVMRDALTHLAKRFAGKAVGDAVDGAVGAVGEAIGDFLAPIMAGNEDDTADVWGGVYA